MFNSVFNANIHEEQTKYLTGLRAYAALSVFLIHSGGGGLRTLNSGSKTFNDFMNAVVDFGKYGVIVFFVLSAFTITMSLEKTEKFNLKSYLARRFLRVIPMYYLILLISFFSGGIQDYFNQFQVTNSLYNLFSHITFINLFQVEHRNNLIGVEWSIPIEIFYYLLFPILYFQFKKHRTLAIQLLIISLSLSLIGRSYLPLLLTYITDYPEHFYHWSILKYFFSFMLGMMFYFFTKMFNFEKYNSSTYLVQLFVLLSCYILSKMPAHEEFIALWTCSILLAAQTKSKLSQFLFENKLVIHIGTISYSLYLVHFPIIQFMQKYESNPTALLIYSLSISLFISTLTYQYIEKPFIKIGKRI